jgi:phenol 2-monooxygenase
MGLYYNLDKKGCKIREYTFWSRNINTGCLERSNIGPDVMSSTPYPWTLAVDKGDLLETLEKDLETRGQLVEYHNELLSFSRPDNGQRISVRIKNHNTGVLETWHTSFILGCDGAESSVRETLGIECDTFDTLNFWAVADVQATTDLPDYRRRCTIRSSHGNCIITPRKRSEFRIRTLLSTEESSDPKWSMANVTRPPVHTNHPSSAMALVNALQTRISVALNPYAFSITDVSWISQYCIHKSLAKQFSDATGSVFLLGSASHTHSPMTKQSMNGGMMDALNLTWKLALVIKGLANREVLASYEAERRTLLVKALEFDSQLDQMFAMRTDDAAVIAGLGFHSFEEASGYTSGCGARYPVSNLVKEEVRNPVKKSVEPMTPGKRLLPAMLIRQLDGNEVDLLHLLDSTGRFTLVCFVGDIIFAPVVKGLSRFLVSPDSPLHLGIAGNNDKSPLLELLIIHTTHHTNFDISDLSDPWPRFRENILEDQGARYHMDVGLNPGLGGLCLVRPDGYIALVTNLDNTMAVTQYLIDLSLTNLSNTSTDTDTVVEPMDHEIFEPDT